MTIGNTNDDSNYPNLKDPVPLQHNWCFWQDSYNQNANNTNFVSNLTKVSSINTVQEFWSTFNNLPSPDTLTNRSNIHFFKEGVKPLWEDPKNEFGGAWSFRVAKEHSSKVWPEMLMLCIGELLEEKFSKGDEVVGISIGSRWNSDILQIWNSSAKLSGEAKFMEAISEVIDPSILQTPYYKAHKDHTDFKRH